MISVKIRGIALIVFMLLPPAWADSYSGTGKNFGEGWQRDSQGNLHGTGKNFGQGWAPDGNGGYRGTGTNFGKNWASDGRGGLQGSGETLERVGSVTLRATYVEPARTLGVDSRKTLKAIYTELAKTSEKAGSMMQSKKIGGCFIPGILVGIRNYTGWRIRKLYFFAALILLAPSQACQASDVTEQTCLDIARSGMIADGLEQLCDYKGSVKDKLKSLYATSVCPSIVRQKDLENIAGEVLPAIRNEFAQMGKGKFCKESKASYHGLAESVEKSSSEKKKVDEGYGIPSSLGLPSVFPKKFQECRVQYQDAANRLNFILKNEEYKIGRSIQLQDNDATDNLMHFTQHSVQVQKNLNRWLEDCLKQSENAVK